MPKDASRRGTTSADSPELSTGRGLPDPSIPTGKSLLNSTMHSTQTSNQKLCPVAMSTTMSYNILHLVRLKGYASARSVGGVPPRTSWGDSGGSSAQGQPCNVGRIREGENSERGRGRRASWLRDSVSLWQSARSKMYVFQLPLGRPRQPRKKIRDKPQHTAKVLSLAGSRSRAKAPVIGWRDQVTIKAAQPNQDRRWAATLRGETASARCYDFCTTRPPLSHIKPGAPSRRTTWGFAQRLFIRKMD